LQGTNSVMFLKSTIRIAASGDSNLNLKEQLSPKIVLILLFLVVALEAAALQIYMQMDNIVNVDLYRYGLQFTAGWAEEYWISYRIVIACLLGAPITMAVTLIPYYTYSRDNTPVSRWSCILFPLISASFVAVSLYFIMQIDYIINVTLYQYGLQLSADWISKYLIITRSTLAMVETAVIVPIIMALITWEITRD
jgi:hypothetical protein